jgi:hypothetical protein
LCSHTHMCVSCRSESSCNNKIDLEKRALSVALWCGGGRVRWCGRVVGKGGEADSELFFGFILIYILENAHTHTHTITFSPILALFSSFWLALMCLMSTCIFFSFALSLTLFHYYFSCLSISCLSSLGWKMNL